MTEEKETGTFTYGDTIEGKIIKINMERGYGYITSEERKFKRFFFHWTALRAETETFDNLCPGMKVRFVEAYNSVKGPRAVQIEVLEKKPVEVKNE